MANRKIAYTLGRGRAYIFDMSSTSGYMGEKYFQEFGPRFFDMSSASGYMGEKYFQEFGPRFLGAYPLAHTPLREVSKERGSCTWPCLCLLDKAILVMILPLGSHFSPASEGGEPLPCVRLLAEV